MLYLPLLTLISIGMTKNAEGYMQGKLFTTHFLGSKSIPHPYHLAHIYLYQLHSLHSLYTPKTPTDIPPLKHVLNQQYCLAHKLPSY